MSKTQIHRHRFDTREHGSAKVRKCRDCGAVQVKESNRWLPIAQASTASRQLATVVFASSVITLDASTGEAI